jgi:hypothetical protein
MLSVNIQQPWTDRLICIRAIPVAPAVNSAQSAISQHVRNGSNCEEPTVTISLPGCLDSGYPERSRLGQELGPSFATPVFRFKIDKEFVGRGAEIDYGLCDQPYGCREFGTQDIDGHDIGFGQVVS